MNIDAPSRNQLEIPRVKSISTDVPSKIDKGDRWRSKLVGSISYGLGICAYLAHESIGSGSALTITVLFLTLMCHVRATRVTHLRHTKLTLCVALLQKENVNVKNSHFT